MSLTKAFVALGLLLGGITALSGSPIATILVPAIFSLFGGSILPLLSKIKGDDRKAAAAAIFAFSISCGIAIVIGILANVHQLLGPLPDGGYLRGVQQTKMNDLEDRLRRVEQTLTTK